MQSLPFTIPTPQKVEYINLLLKAGFDTVEVGSMASPKFVPQMADTLEVLKKLDLSARKSKVMVLVLNLKGAEAVAGLDEVDVISYPYSISPQFLKKNMNVTPEKSLEDIRSIRELCVKNKKEMVIYISMAFGNPYGDEWNLNLLITETEKLVKAGATVIPLSNVSMLIDETRIREVFPEVIREFPDTEIGLHLHTDGKILEPVIDAACSIGIRRFDTVFHGIGGCPMTDGKMLGNVDTAYLVHHVEKLKIHTGIDKHILNSAGIMARNIFRLDS